MEGFLSGKGSLNLPPVEGQDTIFEYLVNEQGEWEHWSQRVSFFNHISRILTFSCCVIGVNRSRDTLIPRSHQSLNMFKICFDKQI